jgi:hypothetical protein
MFNQQSVSLLIVLVARSVSEMLTGLSLLLFKFSSPEIHVVFKIVTINMFETSTSDNNF